MKKTIMFVTLAVAMLFSGCEVVGPEMRTEVIDASARQWNFDNVDLLYYQDYSFPEINSYVMDKGLVQVSMISVVDGKEVQHALPYVFPVDIYDGPVLVGTTTENIRYEVRRGLLTLVIEFGDREAHPIRDNYTFKVTILD
ncbi:MAG: hypothetical protein MJY58_05235 [Bacteroidaceae bacterium]|nr:hypothetical protein [Bacteroidaceae bacterium]